MIAPLETRDRGTNRPPRPGDRVRGVAGIGRLVAGVLLAALAPLAPGSSNAEQVRFGVVVAVTWLPVAGLLAMVARRRRGPVLDVVTLGVDLTLLVMARAMLGIDALVIGAGCLLVVAVTTYVAGRGLGAVAAVAGSGLVVAAIAADTDPVDRLSAVGFPLLALAVCLLIGAVNVERSRASAGLRRTIEKSDAILTGVAEAVVVTSPGGRVAQWNRSAERTFGCSADDAHGRQCADALGLRLDVRELDCSHGCALLELAEAGTDVEVWRRGADGERQPLLASAMPVYDAAGRVVEVVHSLRDITKLKQADEAKTLFLATASHELKTPLTVISGFSQMLLAPDAELTDEERGAALRAIERRSRELNGIVDRLLMSSRIEAGRIDLAPRPVEVVAALEERVLAYAKASSRDIRLAVAPDLPAAWADLDALTTAVDHLLDNAVKYSPGGGPIRVSAAADADELTVSIADEGVGMDDEAAAACFQRFWQAEQSDVRRFGGTGIGLYIVRSLVEAMQGSVSVRSAPGAGSTFRIALWRADRRRAAAPADGDGAPSNGRGDRSIIREYMKQMGLEVEA